MEAIILAAGLGTRLRPYTLTTPKPLLPIQGRPILDWTLAALPAQVKRVLVVVNYLAEQFDDYLNSQKRFADFVAVRQAQPKGTGDALRSCIPHLRSSRFMVLNGDDLYGSTDLAKLANLSAGLLVQPVDEPRKFGIAYVKPDGSLEKLVEKPDLDGRQLANTGAYLFPRHVFDAELRMSARGEFEITDYVSALAAKERVDVVQADFWLPIGTVEVWQQAQGMELASHLSGSR